MKCHKLFALSAVVLSAAAAQNVAVSRMARQASAGTPVLGYVLGPGPAEVHPILGTAKTAKLGEAAVVPAGAKRLYLPPRQQYALVESSSDAPTAVWALHRAIANQEEQEPVAIAGAIAHPDLVAFSPRGEAAALYSQATGTLQMVGNLPAQPSVKSQLSIPIEGTLAKLVVTDDAALAVAASADGSLRFSLNGAAWRPLAFTYRPDALIFVPNAHSLALSDNAQKTIVLLEDIGGTSPKLSILAQDLAADQLGTTKSGNQLLALDTGTGQISSINLKTGNVVLRNESSKAGTLASLRSGFTFLLSLSPNVALLTMTDSPDVAEAQPAREQ